MPPERVPFVWLCGPSGVGKSSVGWEVYRQLVAEGTRSAYVDFDQIGFCRPAPDDDPDNNQMSAVNLGAVWPNYRAAGARVLVTSGIVHTHAQIARYAGAVPNTALTVCRLRASDDELRRRILLRGAGGGPALPGDALTGQSAERLHAAAADSIAEAREMERDALGDLCVDTDGVPIEHVARIVRQLTGLTSGV